MKISIDSLNYDELVELNHKIVERLKLLDSMHTYRVPGRIFVNARCYWVICEFKI
jgi:hypothetical protein